MGQERVNVKEPGEKRDRVTEKTPTVQAQGLKEGGHCFALMCGSTGSTGGLLNTLSLSLSLSHPQALDILCGLRSRSFRSFMFGSISVDFR